MASLTNQQIDNTYKGLLKLADSTTGITQTLQSVEDGLGNDTGVKIAQNFLTAPSVLSYKPIGKASGGVGITTGAGTSNTNFEKICGNFFLDDAVDTYTGITFAVGTTTSTADEIYFAFYSVAQTGSLYGLAPENLIMSGITLDAADLAVTGFVTKALPSPLTLTEPGVYFLAYYITNPTAASPTARLRGSSSFTDQGYLLSQIYGTVLDGTGASYQVPFYGPTSESNHIIYGGTPAPFLASYVPSAIASTAASSSISYAGFVLRK